MDLLIKDALVIDPNSAYHQKKVSIKIIDNRIAEIGENLIDENIETLNS